MTIVKILRYHFNRQIPKIGKCEIENLEFYQDRKIKFFLRFDKNQKEFHFQKPKKVKIYFKDKSFIIGYIYTHMEIWKYKKYLKKTILNFLIIHPENKNEMSLHRYIYVSTKAISEIKEVN